MNLRVKILYFADGVPALGGRMSIASEAIPGVPTAKRISRVGGGYLIGFEDKLHFVPDTRVLSAIVEELPEDEEPRKPKAKA